MDDMYQYAASAVNDKATPVPEEDDVILKTFNKMSWGKKWSSLLDTVKKQGGALVEETRKEFQEMAHVLSESMEENNNLSDSTETLRNNTVNRNNTSDHIDLENWNLTQLREGITNGTRSAEVYLHKFGNEILDSLKKTINGLGLEGEDDNYEAETGAEREGELVDQDRRLSRKEANLAKIYTSQDIYLNEPIETDKKLYNTFISGFHINDYKDEISQLLEHNPNLKETMNRLVPVQVTYSLFWQRYFYYIWKLDQDEAQRESLDSWDGSGNDADNDTDTDGEIRGIKAKTKLVHDDKKENHTAAASDTDFSHISGPPSTEASLISPSLRSEDDWVKAERKRSDDESDWE